jgi:hypothetical protein
VGEGVEVGVGVSVVTVDGEVVELAVSVEPEVVADEPHAENTTELARAKMSRRRTW